MASLSLYNSQVHLESVYPLHCKQNVCFFKILFQLYIPEDPVAVKTSIRNGNPNNLVNQSKPKEYALNINSISSPSLFLSLYFSLFFLSILSLHTLLHWAWFTVWLIDLPLWYFLVVFFKLHNLWWKIKKRTINNFKIYAILAASL